MRAKRALQNCNASSGVGPPPSKASAKAASWPFQGGPGPIDPILGLTGWGIRRHAPPGSGSRLLPCRLAAPPVQCSADLASANAHNPLVVTCRPFAMNAWSLVR